MNHFFRSVPLLLASFGLAVMPLRAQTVQFYGVNKIANYDQSSASTPALDGSSPYLFESFVSGSNLNLLSGGAPTFTSPVGSGTTSGTLILKSGNNGYNVKQDFATKTALDIAFNNGTYTMNIGGHNGLSLGLTPDSYPVSIPQVTGTANGAVWNGSGQLVINPNTGDTLNFSTFSAYTSGGHIDFNLNGTESQSLWLGTTNQAAITSFVIAPGSLVSGDTYSVDLQFSQIVGSVNTSGPSGSDGVAIFSNELSFTILAAVPEPATAALGLGVGALLALLLFRRRRRSLA